MAIFAMTIYASCSSCSSLGIYNPIVAMESGRSHTPFQCVSPCSIYNCPSAKDMIVALEAVTMMLLLVQWWYIPVTYDLIECTTCLDLVLLWRPCLYSIPYPPQMHPPLVLVSVAPHAQAVKHRRKTAPPIDKRLATATAPLLIAPACHSRLEALP